MKYYTHLTITLPFLSLNIVPTVTIASEPTEILQPMMVTAARINETVDNTLASVTVITRKEIEQQQAMSIQDLLHGIAGISITNNGGSGKATSIFFRGTESDQLLVLINGVKIGSATLGVTAFQDIPIEQIERIEIVRGPVSSLYGSEAIGGVIQIFTRKGNTSTEIHPSFSLGAGRYDTYTASANLAGGSEKGWFNISSSYLNTGGFNACRGKPFPDGAGCFTNEWDKDGYDNLSTSMRLGYQFSNTWDIDAHLLYTDANTDFDGGFVNESELVQSVFGGTLHYTPLSFWDMSFSLGQSQDKSDNFKDGIFQSRFKTQRNTLSWQNNVSVTKTQIVSLGIDYQKDKVSGTTNYLVNSRDNVGIFSQYKGNLGQHTLQLSLRQDNNEQFATHTTGSAAWGYTFKNKVQFTLTYGNAFKAPTFNELYFPDYGNPDISPEKSTSIEVGIEKKTSWGRWSSHIYQTKIDDLIAYDADIFMPNNINQAQIYGGEMIVDTRLNKHWNITTQYTFLDTENRSTGNNKGNRLPRRAKHALRLDTNYTIGHYLFTGTLLTEGKRYDDLANSRKLAGYSKIDLRAEYTFSTDWIIQARIENILDKTYETAAWYNQAGRSAYLTLRYQP